MNHSEALLVIDMLNGFLSKNGSLFCGEESRSIIPFVIKKIEEYISNSNLVVFIQDAHTEDDPEFKIFPQHCKKGTWDAELIDELKKFKDKGVVIEKQRYSGFWKTDLDEIIKKHNIKSVGIVGVCTSICCLFTAVDALNRGLKVKIFKQGVADFNKDAHSFALRHLKFLGCNLE